VILLSRCLQACGRGGQRVFGREIPERHAESRIVIIPEPIGFDRVPMVTQQPPRSRDGVTAQHRPVELRAVWESVVPVTEPRHIRMQRQQIMKRGRAAASRADDEDRVELRGLDCRVRLRRALAREWRRHVRVTRSAQHASIAAFVSGNGSVHKASVAPLGAEKVPLRPVGSVAGRATAARPLRSDGDFVQFAQACRRAQSPCDQRFREHLIGGVASACREPN
jgi:hypothetical protein